MQAQRNYSSPNPLLKCLLAAILMACPMLSTAVAQQGQTPQEKKAALFNAGQAAFGKGDYATAISSFEAIIPLATADDNAAMEGVYFYLGASYFNTQVYDKAIEAFKKFQAGYPKSARLNEVLYSIAQAEVLSTNWDEAVTYFKLVEAVPQYHELALYYEGIALKNGGKADDAVATLEKLVLPEIRSSTAASASILLVELYAKKKDFEKASAMIREIRKKLNFVDDMMALNHQAIELGDECMTDALAEEALLCYRMVRSRDEVVAFQIQKLKAMAQEMTMNNALIQADPSKAMRLAQRNAQLRAIIIAGNKRLEDYKKEPDVMPGVLLRIGRAFYSMHRQWESIVAFNELLARYPDSPEVEGALFSATVSSAEAIRPAATKEYAAQYVKKFPDGKHIVDVKYLVGLAASQAEDWQAVVDAFGAALKDPGENRYKEEMEMQVGNAEFMLGKFADAGKMYDQYKTDFPSGSHLEEAIYRRALTSLFAGGYEEAMKGLSDYIAAYPKGAFLSDARYRLDMCKYAASQYDEVIADCRQWENDYPKDPLLAEVLALRADSLDATGKEEEAIQVYIRSVQLATRDETRDYSLSAAQKLLRKLGDWDRMGQMCEDFMKQYPASPLVPQVAFWLSQAMLHNGKSEEAKQFMADTIRKYISDPRRDAVDQLLMQLAQLCVRKRHPVALPSPSPAPAGAIADSGSNAMAASTPSPTPAPTPEAVPEDPGAELDKLLAGSEQDSTPTAQARILFAKAQLAFDRQQNPEKEKNYQAIADKFKPEDLSSYILGLVGDYLLEKGQTEKAKAYYDYLLDEYPKSDVLDFAYNGIAQIAFDKKDYDTAFRYYNDSIEKGIAGQKLKELTFGKAKTLANLKRYAEALPVFEEVAGNRQWRGPLTAESLYLMGFVEQEQGKFNEAITYYQRVYVAYQRYPQWVAKAYLQSGICFEKLGKTAEAINTYKEMLANEKVAQLPEAGEARKRLAALGGGGPGGTLGTIQK